MIAHELHTGLLFEAGGRTVATVDTSRGFLELRSRRGRTRTYAASIAGVRVATELLTTVAHRARDTADPLPRQSDLFARTAPQAGQPLDADAVHALVLDALRRAARARHPLVDELEAAVAREHATPLVLFGPVLALPFFARDASRQRAAAIAAAFVETLPHASESVACATTLCANLHQWPRLFSPAGVTSRALHKTLAELPEGARAIDVWALRRVQLVRPVRSGLHLRLVAERARGAEPCKQEQLALVQHAEPDELLEARARVARALMIDVTDERAVDHAVAELLSRCGAPRPIDTLSALLRRGLVGGRRRRDRHPFSLGAHTVPPPIPALPCARFLGTVGEVVEEGARMRHCVGSHAIDAVGGKAFIFHAVVDHTAVTVEVNANGRVVEASGVANDKGPAVAEATRMFEAWGAGFWAARVGGLALSTWVEPAPPMPPGYLPLRTVAECLAVFLAAAPGVEQPWRELSSWFEDHVARAIGGRVWLVARTRAGAPRVLAVDARGAVVGGVSERGALLSATPEAAGDEEEGATMDAASVEDQ